MLNCVSNLALPCASWCAATDTQTQHTSPYACTTTGLILSRQVETLRYMFCWHVLTQTYKYEQSHWTNTQIHTHAHAFRKCPEMWGHILILSILLYSPWHQDAWHFHNEEILNRHWCNHIICIYIPLKGAPATPPKQDKADYKRLNLGFLFFHDTPAPTSSQLIGNSMKVIADLYYLF